MAANLFDDGIGQPDTDGTTGVTAELFTAEAPNLNAYPAADSCIGWTLAQLLTGRSLTHRDAIEGCGTHRLAAVVHALRKIGWAVSSVIYEGTNRMGYAIRFSGYMLPPVEIRTAGVRGKKYSRETAAAWSNPPTKGG